MPLFLAATLITAVSINNLQSVEKKKAEIFVVREKM